MMKIFITVGTTPFNALVEFLDKNLEKNHDVLFQISNKGTYIPKNFKFMKYIDDIDSMYKEYDYIITHAGSGTIYKLLSLRKKFIVIPNLNRVDKHQKDISEFVNKNFYALTCINFSDIIPSLRELPFLEFNHYDKKPFVKIDEISELIDDSFI